MGGGGDKNRKQCLQMLKRGEGGKEKAFYLWTDENTGGQSENEWENERSGQNQLGADVRFLPSES